MKKILIFIATYLSAIFKRYGVRFADSEASSAFGDNAYVDLSAENFNVRIVNDRGQLFMDFQAKCSQNKQDPWYSLDLVRSLLTGETSTSSVLDDEYGKFLEDRFGDICALYSKEKIAKTVASLRDLERSRAKRMFKGTPNSEE